MSKIVQTLTVKGVEDHETALDATKRMKTFLEGKGAKVSAWWAIEAGEAAGITQIRIEFPNAAAWAALVDSPDMDEFRSRAVQARHVVGASLLQEVDLS
jgi:hypothetical protein